MKALTLVAIAAALSGCMGLGSGGAGMSPEQLNASAKDKNASAYCVQGTGPWGQVTTLYTNVDKSTVVSGSVVVKCGAGEVTFTDAGKQKP